MVRAILSGQKTQTRRIIKNQAWLIDLEFDDSGWPIACDPESGEWYKIKCPLGEVGDQLWVREAWAGDAQLDHIKPSEFSRGEPIYYPATRHVITSGCMMGDIGKTRPSIFMPRKFSRIQLEIKSIKVERLQSISEEDALAEGLAKISKDGETFKYGIPDLDGYPGDDDIGWHWHNWQPTAKLAFKRLWRLINGAESWDINPWVWAIEFERIEARHG